MIDSLPPDLGIVALENAVFRRQRSDLPLAETLGEYSNAAQVVLGFFQNISDADLQSLYVPGKAAEVIAAGRILDAASEELLAKSDDNLEHEDVRIGTATGLLAMIANAIYGNFPAANTIARRFDAYQIGLSPFQICALCCSAPDFIGKYLPVIRQNESAAKFLENLEAFLRTGNQRHETAARSALIDTRQLLESPFDHSLWMSCEVCFEQLVKLCISKVLPTILGSSSTNYVGLLAKAGLRTLLPPQFLALTQDKLVAPNGNAVICLPTSTGKTLLSEISIYAAVRGEGRIGIFVVPYVALGRQVAERISTRLPTDWKVVRLFGGFKEPNAFVNDTKKMFVVATPERVDALLRFNPDVFDRIDCFVFDEAHMIESGQRGARLEGLITRILLAQTRGLISRLIVVSAVIPNVEQMAKWIGAAPSAIINHFWSPSSRRLAIWTADGRLTWYHGTDPVSPSGSAPNSPIASIRLPWPQRIVPTRWDFAEQTVFEDKNYENLVYLCHFMWEREEQPILCVCATRETTRRAASELGKRFEPTVPTPPETQKAVDLIVTKYPHYTQLKRALLSGVAYHNASLPHDLRAAIEDATWHKELRCVVSTTTLAEGIDLPFRTTILADWVRHKGKTQVPYSSLLVRNIAGRCGRVGYFTEGDIVVYDNPLGDRKLKAPGLKEELQQKVFFGKNDEGVHGSIELNFIDADIQATLASQYLAAIAENPEINNIEQDFAANLFAGKTMGDEIVQPFLETITYDLISESLPLATRNSPLRLTPLGKAVNQSGFSPSSCRRILDCLQQLQGKTEEMEVAVLLLTELGDLPEQGDFKFAALVEREKFNLTRGAGKKKRPPKIYVRLEMLPAILSAWIEGQQPIQIFGSLSTVLESSIEPSFAVWLQGTDEVTSWDAEFDKFSDFISTTIFEFLPWLLRACSLLTPHLDTRTPPIDWQALAEKIQRESTITDREESSP